MFRISSYWSIYLFAFMFRIDNRVKYDQMYEQGKQKTLSKKEKAIWNSKFYINH